MKRRAREEAERRAREAKADYLLGRELAFGLNGTKVDGRRGFELLKKATDAGSVDAKAELAELYLDGCEGTPSDAARAFAAERSRRCLARCRSSRRPIRRPIRRRAFASRNRRRGRVKRFEFATSSSRFATVLRERFGWGVRRAK